MIETLAQQASRKAKLEEELSVSLQVKTEMQEKREDFGKKKGKAEEKNKSLKETLAQLNKELAQAESGLDAITTQHIEGKCFLFGMLG